jgi:hypothetical protein
MKKWIRWQGLTFFAAILILLFAFWFLLVDALVKRLIEKSGTQMVGARVELAGANLSLFPAGLTLTRLQVTNPDEPMKNAVEIARISCKIDGLNLLRRKIIIEEMSVEGVRLGTARTHSGALPRAPEWKPSRKGEPKTPSFGIPSFELGKKEESNPLLAAVASALSDVPSFRVKAKVSGPIENYQVEVSSDLDDQIKKAVSSQLQKYASKFEKDLSSAVLQKVGGPLQGAKGSLGDLDGIGKELQNRLRQMTGLQSTKTPQKLPGGLKLF